VAPVNTNVTVYLFGVFIRPESMMAGGALTGTVVRLNSLKSAKNCVYAGRSLPLARVCAAPCRPPVPST
jgi:hypothetical protein